MKVAAEERFVGRHPAVVESVGRPLQVGRPEGEVPSGRGAAQANLMVPVSGPEGSGMNDLRDGPHRAPLEVLSATSWWTATGCGWRRLGEASKDD